MRPEVDVHVCVWRQDGSRSERVENICGKQAKKNILKITLSKTCSLLSHTVDCWEIFMQGLFH